MMTKDNNMANFLIILLFSISSACLGIGMASCQTKTKNMPLNNIKTAPDFKYEEMDPELKAFEKEFNSLAEERGIVFKNKVTAGFSKITKDYVIGVCNYGEKWREITVDREYWKEASQLTKRILYFHESAHCRCNRKHDYGKDKYYETVPFNILIDEKNGYFKDGCATSIMHPEIQSDGCISAHYKHYINEMFDRCLPY